MLDNIIILKIECLSIKIDCLRQENCSCGDPFIFSDIVCKEPKTPEESKKVQGTHIQVPIILSTYSNKCKEIFNMSPNWLFQEYLSKDLMPACAVPSLGITMNTHIKDLQKYKEGINMPLHQIKEDILKFMYIFSNGKEQEQKILGDSFIVNDLQHPRLCTIFDAVRIKDKTQNVVQYYHEQLVKEELVDVCASIIEEGYIHLKMKNKITPPPLSSDPLDIGVKQFGDTHWWYCKYISPNIHDGLLYGNKKNIKKAYRCF